MRLRMVRHFCALDRVPAMAGRASCPFVFRMRQDIEGLVGMQSKAATSSDSSDVILVFVIGLGGHGRAPWLPLEMRNVHLVVEQVDRFLELAQELGL
jgi:hypothetical protein